MDSPKLDPSTVFSSTQEVADAILAQPDPEAALLEVIRLNLVNDEAGFAAELVRSYKEALAADATIKSLQGALADTLKELILTPGPYNRPCVQQGLRALGRSAGISTFGNDWMDVLVKYKEKQNEPT